MIKAVVFDVEGTLLDSIELRALAWRDALREFGTNVEPDALTPHVAGPEREIPRRFMEPAVLAEVTADAVIARYHDHWENVFSPRVAAFPMGKELVGDLVERGLKVALATRAHPHRIADVVAAAGLTGMVEASGLPEPGAHTPKPGKPSEGPTDGREDHAAEDLTEGEVLSAAHALVEAAPDETLAVVHGAGDAKAATVLGMRVVGLLSGGTGREALEGAGAEHIFASAEEMRENLDDLAPLGFPTARHEAPRSPKTTYDGPTDDGEGRNTP